MEDWTCRRCGDGQGVWCGEKDRSARQTKMKGPEKSGPKSPFYVAPREESLLCVFSQLPALSNIFSPSCLV